MTKLLYQIMLLVMLTVVPSAAMAQVSVQVNIPFPPPIVFAAPPVVVVIPGTYVYVVPDVPEEIFFYNGWWWRHWHGHWYRTRHYDRGWVYYKRVPSFYGRVPSGWRNDYRYHRWEGHPWNYQRIPHQQLQSNWQHWEKNKHWEKQQTWGVQGWQKQPRAPQHIKQQQLQGPPPREARPEGGDRSRQPHEVQMPPNYERGRMEQQPQMREPQHSRPEHPQQREGKPDRPERGARPQDGHGREDKR